MSANYGADLTLVDAFDPLFPQQDAGDPHTVVYAIFRRWTTDPASEAGRRIYGSKCRDLRQLLLSRVDQAILAAWESGLAETAKQDDRCAGCRVAIAATKQLRVTSLRAQIQTADGPFTLVIPFDTFTPQVLDGLV